MTGTDAEDVVRSIYREVLDREPDREGMERYSDLIRRGTLSASDLREEVRMSDEYMLDVAHRDVTHGSLKPYDARNIFFIVGVGRSGTTLLQEILFTCRMGSESAGKDPRFFCNLRESKAGEDQISCWYYVRRDGDFSHLENFIRSNFIEDFFIEKTPDSVFSLDAMEEHFPDSRYVFLERDPYDIVLSQLNFVQGSSHRREVDYHRRMLTSAGEDIHLNAQEYWARRTLNALQLMAESRKKTKRNSVRYERLVDDFEGQMGLLEEAFGITAGRFTRRVLKRPAASSRNNTYRIREVTNPESLRCIKEARKLLGYD